MWSLLRFVDDNKYTFVKQWCFAYYTSINYDSHIHRRCYRNSNDPFVIPATKSIVDIDIKQITDIPLATIPLVPSHLHRDGVGLGDKMFQSARSQGTIRTKWRLSKCKILEGKKSNNGKDMSTREAFRSFFPPNNTIFKIFLMGHPKTQQTNTS